MHWWLAVVPSVQALLPLLILQQTGVLNSHKDRRRARDTNAPCESSNPLDTTDDDCYTARWNLMVSYFPAHVGLQQMDSKVVQGEAEVENLWSAISEAMKANNGSLSGPSGHLILEAVVVNSAAAMLSQSMDDGVGVLGATQMAIANLAMSDVRALKNETTVAFASLEDAVANASDKQSHSQLLNTNLMNSRASEALRSVVQTLVGSEQDLSTAVQSGAVQLTKLNADAAANFTAFQNRLDTGLTVSVSTANTTIDAGISALHDTGVGLISDHTDSVSTLFENGNEDVISQAGGVQTDLQLTSNEQLTTTQSGWQTASDSVLGNLQNTVNSVDDKITNFTATVAALLTASAGMLDDKTAAAQSSVQNGLDSAGNATKTLWGKISKTADDTDQSTTDAKTSTDGMATDITTQVGSMVPAVSSVNSDGMDSLTNSLGQVQSDTQSGISNTEGTYTDNVSTALGNQGANGIATSSNLGSFSDKIQSAQKSTDTSVASAASSFSSKSKTSMGSLMDAMDMLDVGNIGDAGSGCTNCTLLTSGVADLVASVSGPLELGNSSESADRLNQASNLSRIATQLGSGLKQLTTTKGGLASIVAQPDETSDLAANLGRSDEDLANSIDTQVSSWKQRKRLTVDQSDLRQIYTSAQQKLAHTKSTSDQTDNALEAGDQAVQQAAARASQKTDLMRSALTQVASMLPQGNALDTTLSTLALATGAFVNSSNADLQIFSLDQTNAMTDFIHVLLNRPSPSVATKSSALSTDTVSNTLSSLTASSAALGSASVPNKLSASASSQTAATLATVDSFSKRTDALEQAFLAAQTAQWLEMQNFTQSLRQELLNIPGQMRAGAILSEGDMQLTGSALSLRIGQLQQQLANLASTYPERASVSGGLGVLMNLQAVQDEGIAGDTAVRASLAANTQTANAHSQNASIAMQYLGSALETAEGSDCGIGGVTTQTATLMNRLASVADGTTNEVSNNIAQSTLRDMKGLQGSRSRIESSGQAGSETVNSTYAQAMGAINSIGSRLGNTTGLMGMLSDGTSGSSDAVYTLVASVLSGIQSGIQLVNTSTDDPLTQLTSTRSAMTSFLALWKEYADAESRKLTRISAGGDDFVASVEADINSQLSAAAANTTRVRSLTTVPNSAQSESSWEEKIGRNLSWLLKQVQVTHEAANSRMIGMDANLDALANFAAEFNTNQLGTIQQILENTQQ